MAKLDYGYASAESANFTTLIYGDFASGKTTIAASANLTDDLGPILVIDIDDGLASVSHWGGIRRVAVHTPAEFEQVMSDVSLPDETRPEILKGVKTIVIDSISAARDEQLLAWTAKEATKGRREDKFSPEWKDYGKMSRVMLHYIHQIKALRYNMILVAGSVPILQGKGDDAVQVGIRPNLNNNLLQGLNYGMSNIWYAERSSDKSKYRLLVDEFANPGIRTKTRNTLYAEALRKLTLDQAVERGVKDPSKSQGWYYIPDHRHPTLPILASLYRTSGAAQAE